MAMAADNPTVFSTFFRQGIWRTRKVQKRSDTVERDHEEVCARREIVNRMMCENAMCVSSEHGIQAMMSMYPREF